MQLDNEDKDYNRLLWKEPNSTDIKTFRMTRVTYGIASSAFHSIRPLQVLAEDVADKKVELGIMTDMYVDDFLTGAAYLKSAKKLQDSMKQFFQRQGLRFASGLQVTQNLFKDYLQVFEKLPMRRQ